jgi:hypothetical protein
MTMVFLCTQKQSLRELLYLDCGYLLKPMRPVGLAANKCLLSIYAVNLAGKMKST